jgi:hypothetical protein
MMLSTKATGAEFTICASGKVSYGAAKMEQRWQAARGHYLTVTVRKCPPRSRRRVMDLLSLRTAPNIIAMLGNLTAFDAEVTPIAAPSCARADDNVGHLVACPLTAKNLKLTS